MTHSELEERLRNDDFWQVAERAMMGDSRFGGVHLLQISLERLEACLGSSADVNEGERKLVENALDSIESAWQKELHRRRAFEDVVEPVYETYMGVADLITHRTVRLRVYGGWMVINNRKGHETAIFVLDPSGDWTLPELKGCV